MTEKKEQKEMTASCCGPDVDFSSMDFDKMSGMMKQFCGEDSPIDKDAMIEKMKQFCGGDSPIDKDAMKQKMQSMCCPAPEKSEEK